MVIQQANTSKILMQLLVFVKEVSQVLLDRQKQLVLVDDVTDFGEDEVDLLLGHSVEVSQLVQIRHDGSLEVDAFLVVRGTLSRH